MHPRRELGKQCAGESGVETLDGIADRRKIRGVEAGLKKVSIVGAQSLRQDGAEG